MSFQKTLRWLVLIAVIYGVYQGRVWERFIPEPEKPRQYREDEDVRAIEQMHEAGARKEKISPQVESLSLLPEGSWIERKALSWIQPTLEKKIDEQLEAANRRAGIRQRRLGTGDTMPLRILSATGGEGAPLTAGRNVTMLLTVWYVNGAEMIKNRPIPLTLGRAVLPAGITEGIKGMRAGETRLLLIPPALLLRPKPEDDALGKRVAFPHQEIVIVEVTLQSAQK